MEMFKRYIHESPPLVGVRKLEGTVKLSVNEWIKVPDNPRQRDTARHAKSAVRKHLSAPYETHKDVVMALCEGQSFKIDGHTRAFLWAENLLERPAYVEAAIWECGSIDDVTKLYDTFDAGPAHDTGQDKIAGAMRQVGLRITSPYLLTYRFSTALRLAYSYVIGAHRQHSLVSFSFNNWSEQEAMTFASVNYFKEELDLLDQIGCSAKRFQTWTFMAAFISLKRSHSAIDFWQKFQKGEGYKFGNEMDGVQALLEQAPRFTKAARGDLAEVVGKALNAIEGQRKGYRYSTVGGLKPLKDENFRELLMRLPKP